MDAELQVGTDVGGYVVQNKLGEGGMGIVYGAHHPSLGKHAAIKVLSAQFCRDHSTVQRFEQEARFVNEIHHPNIVEVYQFGALADGRKYIAMEWLHGQSLSDRIERGPLSAQETAIIVEGICNALEAAHARGIVHRDLKSDNVFLATIGGQMHVKLLDFGLAKLAGNDPRAITKTKTGIVVGTPPYMAPEQIRGKPVDPRFDLYALGVLMFKMLTGQLPFTGEAMQMIIHHLKTPPPVPMSIVPTIPPAMSQLVVDLLAKEPDQRATIAHVRYACAVVLGRPVGAPPPPPQSAAIAAPAAPAAPASAPIPAQAPLSAPLPAQGPPRSAPLAAQSTPMAAAPPSGLGLKGWQIALIMLAVIAAGVTSFVIVRAATHGL